MSSILLSFINAALLLLIVWWMWTRLYGRHRQLWLGYVALKAMAAFGFVWIYGQHYGTGDMLNYLHDAARYRTLAPTQFLVGVISPGAPQAILDQLIYDFDPRAMLMAKVVALAYYLSGNQWFTALNFAMLSGVIIFRFYLGLTKVFRDISYPAMGALLIFPSLLFWTSGICKEAVSFPAMLLVFIPFLQLRHPELRTSWLHWLLAVAGAAMLWLIKYYVAAIVLPACLIYGVLMYIDGPPYRKLVIGLVAYIVLLLAVSELHPNLQLDRTLQVMVDNYELTIQQTQPGKAVRYEGLAPSVSAFAYHFPKAVFTGLFMPLLGQHWDVPSLVVVLQNSALLALLVYVLIYLTVKRRWTTIPAGVWALLGVILLLSGLLAITTPNYGTLERYRVAYQPFMVLLILLGTPLRSKRQGQPSSSRCA